MPLQADWPSAGFPLRLPHSSNAPILWMGSAWMASRTASSLQKAHISLREQQHRPAGCGERVERARPTLTCLATAALPTVHEQPWLPGHVKQAWVAAGKDCMPSQLPLLGRWAAGVSGHTWSRRRAGCGPACRRLEAAPQSRGQARRARRPAAASRGGWPPLRSAQRERAPSRSPPPACPAAGGAAGQMQRRQLARCTGCGRDSMSPECRRC